MGKKSSKKRKQKRVPAKPVIHIDDAVGIKTVMQPLNRVACVECHMDKVIKRMTDCTMCRHHEKMKCGYTSEPYRIRTVSMNEPMKYNRMTFSVSSANIQDDARNYYFVTEIMAPTKHITDCVPYTRLKDMLLKGELGAKKEQELRYVTEIKGKVFLEETTPDNEKDICFYNGTKMYKEVPSFYTGEAQWLVLFYLYEMYSFDGLADIKIDDKFYKIKGTPIAGYEESLVIAINGKNIVIGK